MFPDLMFLRYIASIAGCKPITQATSSSFLTLIVMCSQPSLIWVLFNQVLLDLILNPANLSSSLMCVGILAFLPYCAQTFSILVHLTFYQVLIVLTRIYNLRLNELPKTIYSNRTYMYLLKSEVTLREVQ